MRKKNMHKTNYAQTKECAKNCCAKNICAKNKKHITDLRWKLKTLHMTYARAQIEKYDGKTKVYGGGKQQDL